MVDRLASFAVDDIQGLLPDWKIHLRARNVAPSTISSYLTVARSFVRFLLRNELPTGASKIRRSHIERYQAELADSSKGEQSIDGQHRHRLLGHSRRAHALHG